MKKNDIKMRRIRKGFTLEEACEKLEVKKSLFYKFESGHARPTVIMIAKMARVYECTVDEIFKDFKIEG